MKNITNLRKLKNLVDDIEENKINWDKDRCLSQLKKGIKKTYKENKKVVDNFGDTRLVKLTKEDSEEYEILFTNASKEEIITTVENVELKQR